MASFAHPRFSSSGYNDDGRRGAEDGSGNQVVRRDNHGIGEGWVPYRHGNQREDTYQIMQPEGRGQSGLMTRGVFASNPSWDVSSMRRNVSDFNANEPTNTNVYGLRTSWGNSLNAPRYGSMYPYGRNCYFAGANAALITGAASWENNNVNMPVNVGYDHTASPQLPPGHEHIASPHLPPGYEHTASPQLPPGYEYTAMNPMSCATSMHPRDNNSANMPVNAGYDHTAMNVMGYDTQLPPGYDHKSMNVIGYDTQLPPGYDHTALNTMDCAAPTHPSLHAPPVRMRDFSSSAEFERDGKKMRIPCKYHAKGWCVRGNSCRFLHVGVRYDDFGKKEPLNDYIPSQESGNDQEFRSKDGEMALHEDYALGHNSLQFEDTFQRVDKSTGYASPHTRRSSEIEYTRANQALPCSSSIPKENFYNPLGNSNPPTASSNRHEKMWSDRSSVKIGEMQTGNMQDDRLLDSSGNMGKGVSGAGKKHEVEIHLKKVDPFQLETKALKCFRAALIEYVKEILEPAWLDGLLPKDVYKLTVKSSVEKIIGSLQPEQIPPSTELIKLYISSCQAKIDKLVLAYIERCNLIWICWKGISKMDD